MNLTPAADAVPLIPVASLREPPRVGVTYLVEAVYPAEEAPIPVIGPAHDDREFINPHRHRHIDLRFVPIPTLRAMMPPTLRRIDPGARVRPSPFPCPEDDLLQAAFGLVIHLDRGPIRGPEQVPLVCLREMPPYPLEMAAPWHAAMQAAYAEQRLDACGRCPHKGMPVDGLPVEADGGRTCRGHGLRFDKEGRLIFMIVERGGCRRVDAQRRTS